MTYMLNKSKIAELLASKAVRPLDSELEIEDCIIAVNAEEARIDFLKRLKQNRVQSIDREIQKHEARREFIRSVILETLNANDMKSLDFPGIGRVASRTTKGKWNIFDEEILLEELSKECSSGQLDTLVKTTRKIVKKEFDKLANQRQKAGLDDLSGCSKELDKTNLSITVHEDAPRMLPVNEPAETTEPVQYDKLEF